MTPVSTDSILNSSRSQNLARSGTLPNVRDATQLGSPPDSEVFPVLFNGEDIVMPSSSSNTLTTHLDNLGVDLSNGMVDPPPPVRSPRIITPQTIDPHSGRSYTSPPGSCMTHTIPPTIHDLLPPSTAMMSQAVEDPYAGASPHWIPKHFPPEDDVFLTSSLKDGDFLFSPRPLPGSTMSNAPAADGDDMPLAGLSRLTMRTESPSVSPVPSLLSNSDFGLTHSPVDSVSVKEDEPELPRLTRLQNSDTRFDNPIPFVPSHPGSAAEYSIRDIPRAHESGLSPISERTELNSVPGTPVTHSRHFQPLPRPFLRPEPQHVSMDRPGQRSHGIYTFSPNTPTYQPLTFQYTGSHSSSNASTFHPFSTLVLPPTHSQSFQSVSQTLATQQLQLRQLLAQSPHSQVFSTHAYRNKPTGPSATLNNDPVVPSEVETKNHESSLNPNSHFQSPLPSAFPAMAQLPLSPLASMPLRAANPTGHSTIKNHTGSSPNPYPPGFASYPGYPMSFNIYPHDRVPAGELESAHHSYIPSNPVPLTFDRSIPVPRNRPTLDIPRGRFYFEDGNVIFSVSTY
ncbi:hypothetical protein K435DRAFT_449946 [Dendrothele bispora CBS 962.96]|uniref:Uncharacterized protein n=1 Tax=Dendrothele bispora (strain CBS 962.96) TaxID=1314807 RepID=A0A4S8MUA8_DENBC|nr:hypothetical protein K435DRAFT_449946 [Dendrothele bispora CBS 962.96]